MTSISSDFVMLETADDSDFVLVEKPSIETQRAPSFNLVSAIQPDYMVQKDPSLKKVYAKEMDNIRKIEEIIAHKKASQEKFIKQFPEKLRKAKQNRDKILSKVKEFIASTDPSTATPNQLIEASRRLLVPIGFPDTKDIRLLHNANSHILATGNLLALSSFTELKEQMIETFPGSYLWYQQGDSPKHIQEIYQALDSDLILIKKGLFENIRISVPPQTQYLNVIKKAIFSFLDLPKGQSMMRKILSQSQLKISVVDVDQTTLPSCAVSFGYGEIAINQRSFSDKPKDEELLIGGIFFELINFSQSVKAKKTFGNFRGSLVNLKKQQHSSNKLTAQELQRAVDRLVEDSTKKNELIEINSLRTFHRLCTEGKQRYAWKGSFNKFFPKAGLASDEEIYQRFDLYWHHIGAKRTFLNIVKEEFHSLPATDIGKGESVLSIASSITGIVTNQLLGY